MSYCLNCRGPCSCRDPIHPGKDATYDPDRGEWITWEVWRERVRRRGLQGTDDPHRNELRRARRAAGSGLLTSGPDRG